MDRRKYQSLVGLEFGCERGSGTCTDLYSQEIMFMRCIYLLWEYTDLDHVIFAMAFRKTS